MGDKNPTKIILTRVPRSAATPAAKGRRKEGGPTPAGVSTDVLGRKATKKGKSPGTPGPTTRTEAEQLEVQKQQATLRRQREGLTRRELEERGFPTGSSHKSGHKPKRKRSEAQKRATAANFKKMLAKVGRR